MKITRCKTNHISVPLGFALDTVTVSWVTQSDCSAGQVAAQIRVSADSRMEALVYDSGKANLNSLGTCLPLTLTPFTRYYWTVQVWGDGGDTAVSAVNWFETGRMGTPWQAQWITPPWADKSVHPILKKHFTLPTGIRRARIYATGTGLYELSLNGQRVGQEYFAPGCTAYDARIQIQTYDVTTLLQPGENRLTALLGNGWAKGRFGTFPAENRPYTDTFALLCELRVELASGETVILGTDESWRCRPSSILASGIYDGEIVDVCAPAAPWVPVIAANCPVAGVPVDRTSLPVVVKAQRTPAALLTTPAGETVLDMGQNLTGWLRVHLHEPAGTRIRITYGETLQDGSFYRDNLRTAKAEYVYTTDGAVRTVEPHFTYYGFRYAKLEGFTQPVRLEDFTCCVVFSDLDETGCLQTSDDKVNRLFQNTLWSQRSNFLDIPTDCPQRDERMGWTGDAQVFCRTASFHMDTYAFYASWLQDLWAEQQMQNGMVGSVVPSFLPEKTDVAGFVNGGGAVWGDCAVILPWTLYSQYGDPAILRRQYPSMKAWVDWLVRRDQANGFTHLHIPGFQYGDWLALDGPVQGGTEGGTEAAYIGSAYYCHAAELVSKAAAVLGEHADADAYGRLAGEIRTAIQNEYFTPNGRTALKTQTSYVLALALNLTGSHLRPRVAAQLCARLEADHRHLQTGFAGTPFLCSVLSESGHSGMAYDVFFQEDYPSWLYEVNMGATTVWERWDSILPDGHISGTGMNSLNHYAYGSIAEWMYRHMAGIHPTAPGFRRFEVRPELDRRLLCVKAAYDSPLGRIESGWQRHEDGTVTVSVTIPFGALATVYLPDGSCKPELSAGTYCFRCTPRNGPGFGYDLSFSLTALLADPAAAAVLEPLTAFLNAVPEPMRPDPALPLEQALAGLFPPMREQLLSQVDLAAIAARLAAIRVPIRDNGLRLTDSCPQTP